jgi:hypothetical protein
MSMHADDDLRHEFQEAVYDGDSDRLRPLCGLLWNLHRHHAQRLCDDLSGPHGGTYAQAARAIAEMDRTSPEGTLKLRGDRVLESDEE